MLLLLLLALLLPFSQGSDHAKFAKQDEFNVLVYGTLQLSQAVKDTYSNNNAKLQRIVGRQARQEQTLGRLQAEVSRANQEKNRLTVEAEKFQKEEQEMRRLSHRTEQSLREVQRGYSDLQKRAHALEKMVQVKEGTLPALKNKITQHALILQVLTEEVERQKEQMEKQREKLLKLRNFLKRVSAISSS
ncbi:angiopoietin-like protein 8 [Hyperolius riggenbachi]|uniref:angiopoietin-like protein 8 n=1 Tax=Hyperolius riggenbachi TaxID=752182 RepID=UPI0035A30143